MEDPKSYKKAERIVYAKISFFIHLIVFIIINILLIYLNLTTSPEYYWFKWPLMGWGLGLLFHALAVFFLADIKSIKERMIEKEMNR